MKENNKKRESIRILLTESCNAKCKNCFNKDTRDVESHMKENDFFELCHYLSNNGIKKLKLMGGEPTIHPNFKLLYEHAQTKFEQVVLFTNGLDEIIGRIEPRISDTVVYNFNFYNSKWDSSKILLNGLGKRLMEIQISSDSNKEMLCENLEKLYMNIPKEKIGVNLTLNCVENIYVNKKEIIDTWNTVNEFLTKKIEVNYNIDHNIPFCFFMGSNMKIKPGKQLCDYNCSGLIDTKLRLRYCNQMPKILTNIKNDNEFIPYKIIDNYLYSAYLRKIESNMKKICISCVLFKDTCNGGCFMHKEVISLKDILDNTDLPVM